MRYDNKERADPQHEDGYEIEHREDRRRYRIGGVAGGGGGRWPRLAEPGTLVLRALPACAQVTLGPAFLTRRGTPRRCPFAVLARSAGPKELLATGR